MKFLIYISILTAFIGCKTNSKSTLRDSDIIENGITIVFSDSAFSAINEKRNEAIQLNHLFAKSADFVPAELVCGKKRIKVSARLKGDHIDHLRGNRWSFRIKTKQGEKIFGESKFSIQGLEARGFLNEFIFHQLLEKEGIVHLQYYFVPFSINNIDSLSGYYAFESHFRTEILKLQNKNPGPILKFDESDFWDYQVHAGEGDRDSLIMMESKIKVTNKKGFSKKEKKFAVEQLEKYRKGLLRADEVFDLDKWAKMIAVSCLLECKHNLRWHNLRFYYNPKSKLLEPIGFDSGSWQQDKGAWCMNYNSMEPFYKGFYIDPNFKVLLKKYLMKYCEKSYLDAFFLENKKVLAEGLEIAKKEKKYYWYKEQLYYDAQTNILESLSNIK